jgi:hypothetical protein
MVVISEVLESRMCGATSQTASSEQATESQIKSGKVHLCSSLSRAVGDVCARRYIDPEVAEGYGIGT